MAYVKLDEWIHAAQSIRKQGVWSDECELAYSFLEKCVVCVHSNVSSCGFCEKNIDRMRQALHAALLLGSTPSVLTSMTRADKWQCARTLFIYVAGLVTIAAAYLFARG